MRIITTGIDLMADALEFLGGAHIDQHGLAAAVQSPGILRRDAAGVGQAFLRRLEPGVFENRRGDSSEAILGKNRCNRRRLLDIDYEIGHGASFRIWAAGASACW